MDKEEYINIIEKSWDNIIQFKPDQEVYIVVKNEDAHTERWFEPWQKGTERWATEMSKRVVDKVTYKVKKIKFNLEFYIKHKDTQIYEFVEEAEYYAYIKNNAKYWIDHASDCCVQLKVGKPLYYAENKEIKCLIPKTEFEIEELFVKKKGHVYNSELSILGIVKDFGWENDWL